MAKMNWDAANRQAKLEKWIRQNGNYEWLDELPPNNQNELDAWAKREVRKSVSKVRKQFELSATQLELRKIDEQLDLIVAKLQLNSEMEAIEIGQRIFNQINALPMTSLNKQTREQIVQTLSLLLVAVD